MWIRRIAQTPVREGKFVCLVDQHMLDIPLNFKNFDATLTFNCLSFLSLLPLKTWSSF